MWLLDTHTGELKEFIGEDLPSYAILSHRWEEASKETTFKDYQKRRRRDTIGHKKICEFLKLAAAFGVEWAWVDTCCIDKRSSAELSEAINSMWTYYAKAKLCCVYMNDVSTSWHDSDWWRRGWTLQELLAPTDVRFFNNAWQPLGTKLSMIDAISSLKNLPVRLLEGDLDSWTVAQKMSFAAGRKTTRIEDRAYSLLGLFGVNMPLLYGEGHKAFQRLQLEILQRHPDESIFAWPDFYDPYELQSCLATSPDSFAKCSSLELDSAVFSSKNVGGKRPPRNTSWGIEMRTDAYKLSVRDADQALELGDWFLWAVPLTVLREGTIYWLPCTLVLGRAGGSPFSYQLCGAIHAPKEAAQATLRKEFDLGLNELGVLLFLDTQSN